MVRGNICYYRYFGLAVHTVELEAGKLQNREILRLHLRSLVEQGSADIAAKENRMTGSFKQLCDKR